MLFLLVHLGKDRYALEARRVVEIVPLLELKQLPQAPTGLAGMINFRGCPVPVVDLSELTQERPAAERMSTRIIIVRHPDGTGQDRLLGIIAEYATQMMRLEAGAFVYSGVKIEAAPFLGPVFMDSRGPIQWLHERRLLSEPMRNLIFSEAITLPE